MAEASVVNVPLTDKERQALDELAQVQELTPERVMIQALRLYQLVTMGGAKVVEEGSPLMAQCFCCNGKGTDWLGVKPCTNCDGIGQVSMRTGYVVAE
jgi:hypothetical protein